MYSDVTSEGGRIPTYSEQGSWGGDLFFFRFGGRIDLEVEFPNSEVVILCLGILLER